MPPTKDLVKHIILNDAVVRLKRRICMTKSDFGKIKLEKEASLFVLFRHTATWKKKDLGRELGIEPRFLRLLTAECCDVIPSGRNKGRVRLKDDFVFEDA
jgi:hypothetical protein